MTAVRAVAAGGPASLSRFRGALVAAVLGDCVGGEFEGAEEVPMESVLQHLNSLDDETKGNGILEYSDDTAMARSVVQSLLTRTGFDEQDMARRFAKGTVHPWSLVIWFWSDPGVTVLSQLSVYQPGTSSMFARLGAMLTLLLSGLQRAVLQKLAVHPLPAGEALDLPQQFITRLITEMEEVG
ncbi:poly(ADP-ribose) glycohydrolase ARH3 [Lates japonicus]|uniref:ADP-ribosylhydrolase ARH3 n=1 Tax=Lates japonicus TaxID=270547 RepID=A0AAD3R621_LATJO|nr:poly(ADP-ribose) glycohydrolase ARH3 [Lates japonicus]